MNRFVVYYLLRKAKIFVLLLDDFLWRMWQYVKSIRSQQMPALLLWWLSWLSWKSQDNIVIQVRTYAWDT